MILMSLPGVREPLACRGFEGGAQRPSAGHRGAPRQEQPRGEPQDDSPQAGKELLKLYDVVRTTLPMFARSCMKRCASPARSRGNVLETTGRSLSASIS